MKYLMKVGESIYTVEILDLQSRPIVAIVDGEQFEVWPEEGRTEPIRSPVPAASQPGTHTPAPTGAIPSGVAINTRLIRAPIPGVILEVLVNQGDQVSYGQALFTIEAMKMRNSIRASRAGEVAEVFVTAGQTVNHDDRLLEFVE